MESKELPVIMAQLTADMENAAMDEARRQYGHGVTRSSIYAIVKAAVTAAHPSPATAPASESIADNVKLTKLHSQFIENHPDHMGFTGTDAELLAWGERMNPATPASDDMYNDITKIIFGRYPRIKGAYCASIAYGVIDYISAHTAAQVAASKPAEASVKPIARLQAEVSDRPYSKGQTFFGVVIIDRERAADGMELFDRPAAASGEADEYGVLDIAIAKVDAALASSALANYDFPTFPVPRGDLRTIRLALAGRVAPPAQAPAELPATPHWYDCQQTALGGKTAREGYAANPEYAGLVSALPATGEALTDAQIETRFQERGGKWDGNRWIIEDADLHPFARSLMAGMEFVEAIANDHTSVDNCESLHCNGCGADLDDHEEHKPDCIVLRARAIIAALKEKTA